jgi:plasmid maintenance system antidote protein VapI
MNALNKYLSKNKLTPSKFAQQHGFNQPTIWRIVNDKCVPAPITAKRISDATGIEVKDLLFPD